MRHIELLIFVVKSWKVIVLSTCNSLWIQCTYPSIFHPSICLDEVCDYVFCVLLQTKVLTAIFSLPHGDFLSSWCSSNLPMREEDGSLEYDSFAAAGWVLDKLSSLDLSNGTNLEFTSLPNNMPQTSYEHQRTSLFVKVIANLHCFVPTICEGWFSINDYVNFMTSLISSQQFFLIILIKFSILIHRAGEEPLPSQVFGVLANGPI